MFNSQRSDFEHQRILWANVYFMCLLHTIRSKPSSLDVFYLVEINIIIHCI